MWWSFKSVNHSLNRFVEGRPLVHSGTKPHSELSILLCLRVKLFLLAELKKDKAIGNIMLPKTVTHCLILIYGLSSNVV